MLQSPEDELRDWDSWIESASRGPFSTRRLKGLYSRLEQHVLVRRAENAPQDQLDALGERLTGIDQTLRSRGT